MLKKASDSMGTSMFGIPADQPNMWTNQPNHTPMRAVTTARFTLALMRSMFRKAKRDPISTAMDGHDIFPTVRMYVDTPSR